MVNHIELFIACYHHPEVIMLHLEFNFTTSLICCLRFLVRMSQASFTFRTYILPIQICNHLRDLLLFDFNLLHHILVGYTYIYLCESLNFNTFSITFVYFNIVILTWHDFTYVQFKWNKF